MHRLETISIDLVTRLRNAPIEKQRAATLAACEFALEHSGVNNVIVEKAIEELRRTGAVSPTLRADVRALVEQLDEDAFRAQEASEAGHGRADAYLESARDGIPAATEARRSGAPERRTRNSL